MTSLRLTKLVITAVSITIICIVLISSTVTHAQNSDSTPFYFGIDLSYVNEMDDCGAVYRVDGVEQDAYEIFSTNGANLVRARLWHNPDWTDYSTLKDIKRTFQRAQAQNMSTLLDFHYSDNWADPGRQEIPAAWEDLDTTDALADAVYDYTYATLNELHAEGLTPDFVQVGNETNSGMLKEIVESDWPRDAQLFNAGIAAVREFSAETDTSPQIMLHVAQPENTTWWFTEAEAHDVNDFDVIAISYYPQWSSYSIAEMGAQANFLRQRFGKDVMVVETAYGWTREAVNETADNILNQGVRGYPFSPAGQRQFMIDLTQSLISNGAIGVVYWEPAWVSTECSTRWGQGSHWENATFFDFENGNELHEGIEFLTHDYAFPVNLADGQLDESYGDPIVIDDEGDALENEAAFDLTALYASVENGTLSLALTVAGDVFGTRGNYLIYFDTTNDENGAQIDVRNRPITVAAPYFPEYRLDISTFTQNGVDTAAYTFNQWIDGDWETATFTGGAAIEGGTPSVIEIQFAATQFDMVDTVNIAVVSTDRTRIHTAADILGTDFSLGDWEEPVVIETFVEVSLAN